MANEKESCTPFKTTCGGQALMEGIMMRGPQKQAVVVRKPDGELDVDVTPIPAPKGLAKLPFVRGIFIFAGSMVNGVKALMRSADISGQGLDEGEQKFFVSGDGGTEGTRGHGGSSFLIP